MDGAPGRGRDAAAGQADDSPARVFAPGTPVCRRSRKGVSARRGSPSLAARRPARVETWVESGTEVTPYYDPMLAKIIVRGVDRAAALAEMRAALAECRIAGIETNLEYLRQVTAGTRFSGKGRNHDILPGCEPDHRRRASWM